MPKKYPPLTHAEAVAILTAIGFTLKKTKASHQQWVGVVGGRRRKVTLKIGVTYTILDITSHLKQAGVTRENYYGATPQTARKIGQ